MPLNPIPFNPKLSNGNWYWGYLDDEGVIHVKRYKNDYQLQKCEQMPFCRGIFEPMLAPNLHQAKLMIAAWLTEQQGKGES